MARASRGVRCSAFDVQRWVLDVQGSVGGKSSRKWEIFSDSNRGQLVPRNPGLEGAIPLGLAEIVPDARVIPGGHVFRGAEQSTRDARAPQFRPETLSK